MPKSPLPSNPSLENLKKRAKAVLVAARAGDPQAIALVREHHPRAEAALGNFKLADAQLAIARSHDFASWARLKAHFAIVDRHEWDPPVPRDGEPLADRLVRLACMDYEGWRPERAAAARELLAEHPELAGANIYSAACVGDVTATRALLAADPELADRKGGRLGWEPLLYACYSRLDSSDAYSTLEVARVLLAAGADPNAGFLWRGNTPPFTALTGAFGEGENGNNEPPHRDRDALVRLLLDAGADPNDGQTLYNRHFRRPDDHLVVLLAHGLGTDRNGPWYAELGDRLLSPAGLLVEELWCAARLGFPDRAKLLVEHGADVNGRGFRDGRTPYEIAVRAGNDDIAAYLLAHGARRVELDAPSELAAALAAGRRADADAMLARDPALVGKLTDEVRAQLVAHAVGAGRADAVRRMVELGFSLDGALRPTTPGFGVTAMHDAAWSGNLAGVRLLVELGARTDIRDPEFHGTPMGWAHHNHQHEVVAYLMPFASISAAVACDGVERVAELIAADPSLARAVNDDGEPLAFRLHADLRRVDEMLVLLEPHGFDIDARDRSGRTALAAAIAEHREVDAALLRAHGASCARERRDRL